MLAPRDTPIAPDDDVRALTGWFPDYRISKLIHRGAHSWVVSAIRNADSHAVALKLGASLNGSLDERARLEREYKLLRGIDLPGVVKVLGFVPGSQPAIVLESVEGVLVGERVAPGGAFNEARSPMDAAAIADFLSLAIGLARTIEELHELQIVHNNLNPWNAFWDRHTGRVTLIDFALATTPMLQHSPPGAMKLRSDVLSFIAPEQTGRLSRIVDERADLYALGASFYALLTGVLPFEGAAPNELISLLLAKELPPAHLARPGVPLILSQMVARLTNKTPEDRYQTARGVRIDLEQCREAFQSVGGIPLFDLGARDVSSRFVFPRKLYGKEVERAAVQSAFMCVQQGDSRTIIVTGASGSGKTILLDEFIQSLGETHAYVGTAVFDPLGRGEGVSAITRAFSGALRQLMSRESDEVAQWVAGAMADLGGNASILVDLFPFLRPVLDAGDRLPVRTGEALIRSGIVYQSLARTLSAPSHPLVIVLDQAERADPGAIEILRELGRLRIGGLLLILTVSSGDSADAGSQSHELLRGLSPGGDRVDLLEIPPLTIESIEHVLADAFRYVGPELHAIAAIAHAKSAGNPLFLREYLRSCHATGALRFDRNAGEWKCEIERLGEVPASPNVVELMRARLTLLPVATQQVLGAAAIAGRVSTLEAIGAAIGWSRDEVALALWPAVETGLIQAVELYGTPVSGAPGTSRIGRQAAEISARNFGVPGSTAPPQGSQATPTTALGAQPTMKGGYRFVDERIRLAISEGSDPDTIREYHWRVARHLIDRGGTEPELSELLDVAEHVRSADHAIMADSGAARREDRIAVAHWTLASGARALDARDARIALTLLQLGLDQLHELRDERPWETLYALTRDLHLRAAEAAYRSHQFSLASRLTREAADRAASLIDRIAADHVRMMACDWGNRIDDAIEIGLDSLRKLGVRIPNRPKPVHLLASAVQVRLALGLRRTESLHDLPIMTDSSAMMAMHIMADTALLASTGRPELLPLIAARQIVLSLRYGNHPASAFGYALHGAILCGALGRIDEGYAFGQLALGMLPLIEDREHHALVSFLVHALISHWREPIGDTLQPLRDVVATGEYEYLGAAAGLYSYHSFFINGAAIAESEQAIAAAADLLDRAPSQTIRLRYALGRQFYLNLMGRAQDPTRIRGEAFDEDLELPVLELAGDRTTLYYLASHRLVLCYLMGAYESASRAAEEALRYHDGGFGTPLVVVTAFYKALTCLALCGAAAPRQRRKLMRTIRADLRRLRRWEKFAPENLSHKCSLVRAEIARVRGRHDEAYAQYELAIEQAHKVRDVVEEAVARETAARSYLASGDVDRARTHIVAAETLFATWGATAKCDQLRRQYPGFFDSGDRAGAVSRDVNLSESVDFESALQAAQSVARETLVPRLLETLTRIITENAGAGRGCLLLEHEGAWVVEAIYDVAGGGEQRDRWEPLMPVINYVARTKERAVLSNPGQIQRLVREPVSMGRPPLSVLCLPVTNQGVLLGILYMENTVATDAFPPQRLRLLDLLASHAAISLQNASLSARLREQELLDQELRMARSIQESFLPRNVPAVTGYDFGVVQQPARAVGGDFYDFMPLDSNTLGIVIADVSDKGVPAALGMALTRSLLRAEAARGASPASVLRTVNLQLLENNDSGMFVTVLYGKLNRTTHEFTYARGGHELPLLFDAGGALVEIAMQPGQPLGLFLDPLLDEGSLLIPEGGRMLLVTDGVTDAVNSAGLAFDRSQLVEAVRADWRLPPQALCDSLLAAMDAFRGDAPQFDDFTLIAILRDTAPR